MSALRVLAIISVAVLLCACHRSANPPATKDWVPQSGTQRAPPADTKAAAPLAPGGIRVLTVIVRQESSQTPIAADVFRKSDMNDVFVSVDSTGRAAPNKSCSNTDSFVANPKTAAYLQIEPLPCAATLDFELPSAETTYALVVKGDDAMKSGNFGAAQQFYSLAAERFKVSQPAQYTLLQNKARNAAGQALKISAPTVEKDGDEKLSVETQNKLKEFQIRKNITPSGELDTLTQQALSGTSNKDAIESARQVPAERIRALTQLQPGK